MSASKKALDALEAELGAASPTPWGQWPRARLDIYAEYDGDKESIATFEDDLPCRSGGSDDDEDDDDDRGRAVAEANARVTVAAVNLAAALAAVTRAAMAYRAAQDAADAMPPTLYSDGRGGVAEALGLIEVTRQKLVAALDAFEVVAQGMKL